MFLPVILALAVAAVLNLVACLKLNSRARQWIHAHPGGADAAAFLKAACDFSSQTGAVIGLVALRVAFAWIPRLDLTHASTDLLEFLAVAAAPIPPLAPLIGLKCGLRAKANLMGVAGAVGAIGGSFAAVVIAVWILGQVSASI